MDNLYSAHIPNCQIIQSNHVFRVIIFDGKQIISFTGRIRRQINTNLHINLIILFLGNKVNLLGLILADKYLISSTAKF